MKGRERFLAAANCQPVDKTPIWIMRQAGRYLPEYRKLKERYSFVEMVRTPELALEVTLQPLQRFDLDAAVLFSDILVIPEALGQPYAFREGGGIRMDGALRTEAQIKGLSAEPVEERLAYVGEAIRRVRAELKSDKALLGFGGSPWTLAAYMVEGGSAEGFPNFLEWVEREPRLFNQLMERLCAALGAYFKMQIAAGADAIQIFDSWGALAGPRAWEYSLQWIQVLIKELPEGFPVILFAKGMGDHIPQLLETGARVLSLDETVSLSAVRGKYPGSYALQGNLSPELMSGPQNAMLAAANEILEEMAGGPGHIFNLGHGIRPDAKIENVQALVERVHDFNMAPAH